MVDYQAFKLRGRAKAKQEPGFTNDFDSIEDNYISEATDESYHPVEAQEHYSADAEYSTDGDTMTTKPQRSRARCSRARDNSPEFKIKNGNHKIGLTPAQSDQALNESDDSVVLVDHKTVQSMIGDRRRPHRRPTVADFFRGTSNEITRNDEEENYDDDRTLLELIDTQKKRKRSHQQKRAFGETASDGNDRPSKVSKAMPEQAHGWIDRQLQRRTNEVATEHSSARRNDATSDFSELVHKDYGRNASTIRGRGVMSLEDEFQLTKAKNMRLAVLAEDSSRLRAENIDLKDKVHHLEVNGLESKGLIRHLEATNHDTEVEEQRLKTKETETNEEIRGLRAEISELDTRIILATHSERVAGQKLQDSISTIECYPQTKKAFLEEINSHVQEVKLDVTLNVNGKTCNSKTLNAFNALTLENLKHRVIEGWQQIVLLEKDDIYRVEMEIPQQRNGAEKTFTATWQGPGYAEWVQNYIEHREGKCVFELRVFANTGAKINPNNTHYITELSCLMYNKEDHRNDHGKEHEVRIVFFTHL
ncbi:hypothetical protein UCRPC4_g00345 [Phaeomoniella chlamydospora]|uniref:Uncharacterized protein n=1 Tax=Phaeomoniella chlamydospora TaxID=158046 RepID=A0A0G2F3J2_PHACM|nr:hypothetical protein UCRPC4_g00345 [Phaeomoniella chlamydospora]